MRTIFFIFVAFWSGSIFADSNKINFERTDLRAVAMEQGVAWVQLQPEARVDLKSFQRPIKEMRWSFISQARKFLGL